MANKKGAQSPTKSGSVKARPLRYFYLNEQLHKKLHINRGLDELTAWCYPLHKRVTYSYTDVKRHKEPAIFTREVCVMINRQRCQVELAIINGHIPPPQMTYGLNERKYNHQYIWHEKDVVALHKYFSGVHKGRPRKDGMITPMRLPTLRELRAMIRQEDILYVKDGDTFVPTWAAPDL